MNRWWRLLAAIALLAGCGGGGGNRDLTLITGNVRSASAGTASLPRPWWTWLAGFLGAEAVAQVPGITVSVVNTTRSTTTDEGGLFRLEVGQFGPSNIRFAGEGADATLSVVLPFGGTYEILDVELEGGDVAVGEQRVTFRGPITGVDCNRRLLVVLSGERVSYRVRLTSGTVLRDEDGRQLICADLILGQEADVFSVVEELDTVIATEVQVNPRLAPTPTATRTATPTPEATDTPEDTRTPEEDGTPTRTPTP